MEERDVIERIKKILADAKARGLTKKELNTFLRDNGYLPADKKTDEVVVEGSSVYNKSFSMLNKLIFKVYPVLFLISLFLYPLFKFVSGSPCLISEFSPFGEVTIPFIDCNVCVGVTGAPRLSNLSQEDFVKNYAYTGKPILVEGAVLNWSAIEVFSYDFFKSLYLSVPSSLEEDSNTGQFFSYSSNVRDLKHLFSLSDDVATMATEKWYIGW